MFGSVKRKCVDDLGRVEKNAVEVEMGIGDEGGIDVVMRISVQF